MASLANTGADLDTAFQALGGRWRDVSAVWNDPVSRDFERDYWAPLKQQVHATKQQVARLAQIIAQAERSVK